MPTIETAMDAQELLDLIREDRDGPDSGYSIVWSVVGPDVEATLARGGCASPERQAEWKQNVMAGLFDVLPSVARRWHEVNMSTLTEWVRSFVALRLMCFHEEGDESAFATLWAMLAEPRLSAQNRWQRQGYDHAELEQEVAQRLLEAVPRTIQCWSRILQQEGDGMLPKLNGWFMVFAHRKASDWHRRQPHNIRRKQDGKWVTQRVVEYYDPEILSRLAKHLDAEHVDKRVLDRVLRVIREKLSLDETAVLADHFVHGYPRNKLTRSVIAKLRRLLSKKGPKK